MRILIIDNYDSFTYNLYQYIGEILSETLRHTAFEVIVKRNDAISLAQASAMNADRIIISPGPGTPSDPKYFGVCNDIILHLGKKTPLLGVCLGMQGIVTCFGGKVVTAAIPMHGKTSSVLHDEQGIYKQVPQHIEIMRYHSLIVETSNLPSCFHITSIIKPSEGHAISTNLLNVDNNTEIMGVRHKKYPIEGIQYHPESFATEGGKQLLRNFLL